MYEWPMAMDKRMGTDGGSGDWMGQGRTKGKTWDNYNKTIKHLVKKRNYGSTFLHLGLWFISNPYTHRERGRFWRIYNCLGTICLKTFFLSIGLTWQLGCKSVFFICMGLFLNFPVCSSNPFDHCSCIIILKLGSFVFQNYFSFFRLFWLF